MIERYEAYETDAMQEQEGQDNGVGVELKFAYPLSTYEDTISWWMWIILFAGFFLAYRLYRE